MQEEINSIEKNGTWKLVNLPEKRHKARLVARGYVQEQGIDFVETFSPMARFETVRIILALAAQMRWMEMNTTYKLEKALYGLKQAPRAWYSKIDEFFHLNGFERSSNEPTSSSSSESSEEDTESEGLQLRRSKCGKRHFEVEGKSCDFAMFAGDPTNAESAIEVSWSCRRNKLSPALTLTLQQQQPAKLCG
ncbi:retrovirus-related pol polyprotein from transposon TNT 1-94 [Tanacetum coccineum]